jgi:nicotinamide-nucleotide amidase
MLYAEILSIGEELLSSESETVDTNALFITKQLGNIGIRVLYKTTVGDDESRITNVVKAALNRADVVIVSGGLGPTVDDMTRQSVANAADARLVFHQDLLDDIAEKFARFGVRMSDNNRTQAMLPEGATAIDNPVGTAPGLMMKIGEKLIFCVPGVPREMRAMIENTVIPYLRDKTGIRVIKTRILRTGGIGESHIDEQIGHLERLENPTVGLNAHTGQTDIRITARTATEEEATALITKVEEEIRSKLGKYIFGVDRDPLELAFVKAAKRAGAKVAVLEVGNGNALVARLVSQPESEDYVLVPEMASIEQLLENLPSGLDAKQIAEGLATDALDHLGVTMAVVIVSENDATAIHIHNGREQFMRTYSYSTKLGGPEWSAGWGLAMGWYALSKLGQE